MTVPLVRVAGSPFDRGRLHGAARAAALRAFLDDDLCRLNRILPAPVSMKALRPVLAEYHREISSATPQLLEEIHGLAAGAGIEVE